MSYISSFRSPSKPPKKQHKQLAQGPKIGEPATDQGPEAQKNTDKGDFVGGPGEVTLDSYSTRRDRSVICTTTAEPDQLSQSGDPHPNLERSSSNTAEVAQNSIASFMLRSYYTSEPLIISTRSK